MAERKGTDPKLVARVFDYNALVGYQDGAVVSRTIIDKNEGTVTVFAFDAGQGLSEHTAPFDALLQVIDGTAIVTIEGVENVVKSPCAVIMPANRPHAVRADGRFKMVLVMVRAKEEK
jgi:quercetin dioxygenase-like cupin family protein